MRYDRGGDRAATAATGVFLRRARSDGYPNSERRLKQVQARSDEELPRKGGPGGSVANTTPRLRQSPVQRGSQGDMRIYPGHTNREAGPPGPSSSTNRTILHDPGFVSQRLSEATEEKSTSNRCNGGFQDRALRGTLGATAEGRRSIFTDGFPHHVEKFIPLHPFTIIPAAGGVASAAAAEPRIEPAP